MRTRVQAVPRSVRLMDEVRRCLRLKHYSVRTELACTGWIRRFTLANGKRYAREIGATEVEHFLSGMAVDRKDSAGTQNRAFATLLFLYVVVAVGVAMLIVVEA